MAEAEAVGLENLKNAQQALGDRIRALLVAKGYASVAAPGSAWPMPGTSR